MAAALKLKDMGSFCIHCDGGGASSIRSILLSIVRQVRALYRQLAPDLVHHVALQPVIVGSLAAINLPFVRLNALAGLGSAFTSRTLKAQLMRPILATLLRTILRNPRAASLVQNPDDGKFCAGSALRKSEFFSLPVPASTADVLQPLPEPHGLVTIAFVGRLLEDKGIRTLIVAHDLLLKRGEEVQLLIAGERDTANPAGIRPKEIAAWKGRRNIKVLGQVGDIRALWSKAHIAALPSRREGLPKSLLEAAACGRPIVATDVPGCREVAREGLNALLVPPDDPLALANAIARLAQDGELRRRFGAAGRRLVEENFSSERIGHEIVALYDSLLGRSGGR